MAQDKPPITDSQLRVRLNALPAWTAGNRNVVVIAEDQMLPAVQGLEKLEHAFW